MSVRDFRESTINNMRENLVDTDPDWIFNWATDEWHTLFSDDKTLKDDCSNFHNYMNRRLEVNNITASRLNEIINNIYDVENIYSSIFMFSEQENSIVNQILERLNSEISREDFANNFNSAAVRSELISLYANNMVSLDLSFLKDTEKFKQFLDTLPARQLANVTLLTLPNDQRQIFYQELYIRAAAENVSSGDTQIINQKLSEMLVEDAMDLVYNKNVSEKYGGNQMNIKNLDTEDMPPALLQNIQDILAKEYGRPPTNKEINKYLDHITDIGCGYVALTNVILKEYLCKPQQFELDFGFPLYTIDKDNNMILNYDLLTIDVYTYMYSLDIKDGLNAYNTMKHLQDYLDSHNSESDYTLVNNVNHFDDNYKENVQQSLSEGKSLLVYMNPTTLYGTDDKIIPTGDTAHAVTITGILENGDLIVSSWGKECYLKISDYQSSGTLEYYVIEKD